MLTLEQALRRSAAVTFGLVALAGTAAANGENGPNSDGGGTSQSEPMPSDTSGTNQPTPTTGSSKESSPSANTTVVVEPAAPPPAPAPAPQPTYSSTDYGRTDTSMQEQNMLDKYGIGVSLGGGVEDFTDDTLRRATSTGGGWDVRVTAGTKSPIGFEGSYIGSAQSIDAIGLDSSTYLVGNGLDGKVRVNLGKWSVTPFAFGGVGWRHYSLSGDSFNTSAVHNSDDVLEIPMGAGLQYEFRGLLLDARGEFRYATANDLMPSAGAIGTFSNNRADMHRWGAQANIGYAF
jgi:hypothetical protein